MKSRWLICGFLLMGFACGHKPSVEMPAFSQSMFRVRPASSESAQSRYRVYVPQNRKPGERLPVMLYFHGSDERGSDNESQLSGMASIIEAQPENFPFIVVFPQCPAGRFWDKQMIDSAISELDQSVKEFNADESRLYLAGFSLGGYGAWTAAAMYPDKFAAVVPMSGRLLPRPAERQGVAAEVLQLADAADPYSAYARRLQNTPIWIFHGANDPVVPVENSRRMAKALKDVGNQNFKYTELENTGHASLTTAFNSPEFFDWLDRQYLSRAESTKLDVRDENVYAELLTDLVYRQGGSFSTDLGKLILIKSDTVAPEDMEPSQSLPDLDAALVNDFLEKNKTSVKIRGEYDAYVPHKSVQSKKSLEEIFNESRREKLPLGGILAVSRIGFNEDRTQSLVYIEFYNNDKGLIKKYCRLSWKGDGSQSSNVEATWY